MMKTQSRMPLEEALNKAAGTPLPQDDTGNQIARLVYEADETPESADPHVVELLAVLRSDPRLRIFDGKMQIVAGGWVRTEYTSLAIWLIQRARSTSAPEALTDLDRYLESSDIPCELTVALSGLDVTKAFDLAHGIRIVPWGELRECQQKRFLTQNLFVGQSFHFPTAGLVRRMDLSRSHVDYDKERGPPSPPDQIEILDAALIIGLFGPTAPHVVASWVAPPDWAPMAPGGLNLPHLEGVAQARPFPEEELAHIRLALDRFFGLTGKERRRLRLAMQRLNRAMRRTTAVDSAIDLGIALENLFLHNLKDELKFRLRTRAARFLGHKLSERKEIDHTVGTLYDLRSDAVHTGAVRRNVSGVPVADLLTKGYAVAAATLRRYIADGEPDWERVMFA